MDERNNLNVPRVPGEKESNVALCMYGSMYIYHVFKMCTH